MSSEILMWPQKFTSSYPITGPYLFFHGIQPITAVSCLGRAHELNYEEDEYVQEDNLLLYGTEPEYFLQEDEIPPEFRPDSRSGFYDSQECS